MKTKLLAIALAVLTVFVSNRNIVSGFTTEFEPGYVASLPGALTGVFTVADDGNGNVKKVYFSKGNLWYGKVGSATTATWNFETNQYDSTPSCSGDWDTNHISHFYWSKTESVVYAEKYSDPDRDTSDVFFTNATTETAKSDFTVNGVTGKYRTLSRDEWLFLLDSRTVNGGMKEGHSYQRTIINSDATGVYGMILYPDNYKNSAKESYTSAEWESLESAGCVFLPAAGDRDGYGTHFVRYYGGFWASYSPGLSLGQVVSFASSGVFTDSNSERGYGLSVRLVTDCQ